MVTDLRRLLHCCQTSSVDRVNRVVDLTDAPGVHCVIPAGGLALDGSHWVRARYTHRVAISNHRIVNVADGQVIFRWKDGRTTPRDGFAVLLSCRALSSPTTCRFIPALS